MARNRIPIVPRPPTLKRPKRANGAEHVTMLGVTWRITITEDGSEGISLEVMLEFDVEGLVRSVEATELGAEGIKDIKLRSK